MANKVREPMPAWGKVYTVIAVIIILGLNIAGSAVNAYTEVQCLKNRQNDPYHIDAVYDEISYVTDGNGDTYAIGIDYYEKVDPNAPKKSDNSDEVETVLNKNEFDYYVLSISDVDDTNTVKLISDSTEISDLSGKISTYAGKIIKVTDNSITAYN